MVFGKRGATPPLPRNCKRGEQGRARSGGQPLDERLGRCAELIGRVSQETGQGHFLLSFGLDGRTEGSALQRTQLADAFPASVWGCLSFR